MFAVLGLAVVPLVLWILFVYFLIAAFAPARGAIRVTGEITGACEYFDRGRQMFFATFKAMTPDGRQVTGTGTIGTSWQPAIGKSIALFYHPEDNTLVDASKLRLLPVVVVGVLALVFTIAVGAMAAAVVTAEAAAPPPAPARDHSPRSKHGH